MRSIGPQVAQPCASPSVPPTRQSAMQPLATGLFSIPDLKEYKIALNDEQANMPLIALHTGYKLDLLREKPRLVPLAAKPRKRDRESSSEE